MSRFPPTTTKESTSLSSGTNTSTAAAGSAPTPGPSTSQGETGGDGGRDDTMTLEVVYYQHGDSMVVPVTRDTRTLRDVLEKYARSMDIEPDYFMRNVKKVIPFVPVKLVEVIDKDTKKKVKVPFEIKPEDYHKTLDHFFSPDQKYGMLLMKMKEYPKITKKKMNEAET